MMKMVLMKRGSGVNILMAFPSIRILCMRAIFYTAQLARHLATMAMKPQSSRSIMFRESLQEA